MGKKNQGAGGWAAVGGKNQKQQVKEKKIKFQQQAHNTAKSIERKRNKLPVWRLPLNETLRIRTGRNKQEVATPMSLLMHPNMADTTAFIFGFLPAADQARLRSSAHEFFLRFNAAVFYEQTLGIVGSRSSYLTEALKDANSVWFPVDPSVMVSNLQDYTEQFPLHLPNHDVAMPTKLDDRGFAVVAPTKAIVFTTMWTEWQAALLPGERDSKRPLPCIGAKILPAIIVDLVMMKPTFRMTRCHGIQRVLLRGPGERPADFGDVAAALRRNDENDIGTVLPEKYLAFNPHLEEVIFGPGCSSISAIKDRFLEGNKKLTKVDFSGLAQVRSIGSGWLLDCDRLSRVNFQGLDNLLSVGHDWMARCLSLTNAQFTPSLRKLVSIGDRWLSETGLGEVHFGPSNFDSLNMVGDNWLERNSSLHHATFIGMDNLESIGDQFLNSNPNLLSVSLHGLTGVRSMGCRCLALNHNLRNIDLSNLGMPTRYDPTVGARKSRLREVGPGFLGQRAPGALKEITLRHRQFEESVAALIPRAVKRVVVKDA